MLDGEISDMPRGDIIQNKPKNSARGLDAVSLFFFKKARTTLGFFALC